MVTTVKRTFTRIAPHGASSQATSPTDWTYCAFNEQLQRIAEQLSATIQGVLVGTLVCAMFDIILQVSSTVLRT
jgi:tetrahydromethanopterin S-methyltransferase subunit B